jgi:GAF domain-containing protein
MTSRVPTARPRGGDLVAALRQVVIADSARHKEPTEPVFLVTGEARAPQVKPEILETLPSQALQRATAMAARLFSAPIAMITVVDNGKLRFTSYYGAEVEEIARQVDLSVTSVPLDVPLVIEDGRTDARAVGSPLVTGPLGLRFYAGVPLKKSDGEVIGTLSVLGSVPGTASEDDIANLEDLAALAATQIELQQHGMRITSELAETVPITTIERNTF